MRKQLYLAIKEKLEEIQDIQHIDIWNAQNQYLETEQPFNTPAVFIEFDTINWSPLPHGAREAVITIHLHVVTDCRVGKWEDTIEVFDFLDTINRTLHGLNIECTQGYIDTLTLTASTTDNEFDELRFDTETYSCHVTDKSGYNL